MLMQSGFYIVQHTHILKKPDILKSSCYSLMIDLRRLMPRNIFSIQKNNSFCRFIYARQQIKNRGLSGSVRSDQSIKFPLLNR